MIRRKNHEAGKKKISSTRCTQRRDLEQTIDDLRFSEAIERRMRDTTRVSAINTYNEFILINFY